MVKSDFPYNKKLLLKEIILAPSGSKIFPLKEVPIMKRDANVDYHCLIQ